MSGIPFLTTTAGKGVLAEGNGWAFGSIMTKGVAKEIIAASDLVIALGTRFRDADTRGTGLKIKELVHIDVDGAWINRNYRAGLAVSGDIAAAVRAMGDILKDVRFEWQLEELRKAEAKERRLLEKGFPDTGS